MNPTELEIYKAVREVQKGPTIIRCLCIMCKGYLSDRDLREQRGVCEECRTMHVPVRKVLQEVPEPNRPRLVPLRNGVYGIAVD